jgi:glycosyltransferase involved in cell wall biosynthesis
MVANKPDISVVLLCYRSEERIWEFVEVLKRSLEELAVPWELILIGNYVEGSSDRTPEIVKEIATQDPRIKAVTKVKQGMMGWDMRSGLEVATGYTIAVVDGDGQFPLEDIVRVYEELRSGDLDLVKTYREVRSDGIYRRLISSVYNSLFKVLFPGVRCRDINSKPKIFTEETLKKMDLLSDDWFIDAEIMIQARRLKLNYSEISTQFTKLDTRKSFVKPAAIAEFIFNMILYRIREFIRLLKK